MKFLTKFATSLMVLFGLGLMMGMDVDLANAAEGTSSKLFGVANEFGENLDTVNKTDVFAQLGTFVNYVLTTIGLVSLLMFLYGGFIILTSQGNDEKVGEARKIITYAVVGVVIIALAFALNSWLFGSDFFQS